MSNANNVITWNYATNFTENEKRFNEVMILLIAKVRVITKNPLLSMTMMDECTDAVQMAKAIENGDRSEYLYDRAKKAVDEAATLEEAGDVFYKAFGNVLRKAHEEE